ncbi:MAG: acetyl-CoA carboxylase biotin carboxyl carrier protein [Bacteroidetes bacterium]|uniref:Biotin carboxyl carrier protein of acetyl-CoA carboxylase n=1 Tax=Phaeocystidibacter marisrubri TaxID=1577780 RepID=A0A6L3ZFD1_9FLAO|nr:acetyl-CoA carboxylase biotin carboxyl carrier protein [Phaeocystidibacter marisrubri]KAB2816326.1 acetyl-CoA carboxylase biotin carboxyl carrier protein [Phaeocystidibacter marisrubri]TNE28187.1 MAG: acetyl-CoA carboxylase biotin carboxyl carrier protein [Bacteroidota bacterium]GGH68467.1 acetyl-CoA carboxylase, biotin carboxyl carrier protein [Phaeocystidibacter marisrubri]
MDLKEIQNLIKFVAKSGASEVNLETEDFKITIKTGGEEAATYVQHVPMAQAAAPAPVAAPAPAAQAPAAPAPAAPAAAEEDDSKYVTIKSPMIGTFYRRPSPDKDLFVEVGDEIKPGSVVCIIEAMKLFNEIESEVSGKIVKILVDDQKPVEYDQPLFLVDPS